MTARTRAALPVLLVLAVACSGGGGSGGTASCQLDGTGCPLNRAVDTDGDGAADFVHVAGDFDGNGTTNLADLQPAIAQLSDEGPKRVRISGGPYDMTSIPSIEAWQALDGPYDPFAGIVLESETELVCDEGVVLRAWTDPASVWSSPLGFRLITNTARNDDEIDHHVVIRGCTIDYGWGAPYDGSALVSPNHFSVYLDRIHDGGVFDSEIMNSNHSCVYVRESERVRVDRNDIHGCSAWNHSGTLTTLTSPAPAGAIALDVDADNFGARSPVKIRLDDGSWHHADVERVAPGRIWLYAGDALPSPAGSGNEIFVVAGHFNAIYFFAAYGHDALDDSASFNLIHDIGNVALHTRANSSPMTDTARVVRVAWRYNQVWDVAGACIDVRSTTDGISEGNHCEFTEGITFNNQARNWCSEALLRCDANSSIAGASCTSHADCPGGRCANDRDCTRNFSVVRSVFTRNRSGDLAPVRFQGNTEGAVFEETIIEGSRNRACVYNGGNVRDLVLRDVELRRCDREGWLDAGSSSDLEAVTIDGLSIEGFGLETVASGGVYVGMRMLGAHRGWVVSGLECRQGSASCLRFQGGLEDMYFSGFRVDGTRAGFLGRMSEAEAASAFSVCDESSLDSWLITWDADGRDDCDFASQAPADRCHGGPAAGAACNSQSGCGGGICAARCVGGASADLRCGSDDDCPGSVCGARTLNRCYCNGSAWVRDHFQDYEGIQFANQSLPIKNVSLVSGEVFSIDGENLIDLWRSTAGIDGLIFRDIRLGESADSLFHPSGEGISWGTGQDIQNLTIENVTWDPNL